MHKLTKPILHLWISIVSIGAFVIGWAFLAHAEKPAPLTVTQPQTITISSPSLEPIPSLEDYLQKDSQVVPVLQSPSITIPRLRTRGS
jgi:hypothetical protein